MLKGHNTALEPGTQGMLKKYTLAETLGNALRKKRVLSDLSLGPFGWLVVLGVF